MSEQIYLGLDLGTSGLRGLLVTASGDPVASAQAHYSVSRPHTGWSEQDPSQWITALEDIVTQLRKTAPDAWTRVAGIGVSGHMHGAVLLDADRRVIRPCILWNDTRSATEAARIDSTPDVRALSGNIVFPGFTAPKLAWLKTHEPDAFARVAKAVLPAAYLNYWLTHDDVGDISDASGTSWLDVEHRHWSDRLLAAGEMTADQMPRLVEGSQTAGTLRADLAGQWGLSTDVHIAGGAADNAAAACGAGVLSEGQGFVSLGTSGVVFAARDSFAPDPATAVHTFCHAVPDRWYQMGVILAATDCLNWLSQITGKTPKALTADLGDTLTAPSGLQFLPYLSGERTPHNDSAIRGCFVGLDITTSVPDMTRAVLAGVAYALRDSFEALKATGARFNTLLALGGGTGSRHWVEMVATVLNTPLSLPQAGDFGAALGAARLAQCAVTGAEPDVVMTTPPIAEVVEPVAELVDSFETGYTRYVALYPAIKALA